MSRIRFTILAAGLALASLTLAQSQPKRTLKPDDYKQWESLVAPQISNDGHWLSYQIALVDGDGRLVIRNSDNPDRADVPNAAAAQFSDDSKWIGYTIAPPKAVSDRLRDEKKPIENRFGLRSLASGKETVYDGIQAWRFLKGSKTLLLNRYRGAGKQDGGADMVAVDLQTGQTLTIGNVIGEVPNEKGDLVAMAIVSDSGQKGVQILDTSNDSLKTIQWGKEDPSDLSWAAKSDVLGFLVGKPDEKKLGDSELIALVSDIRKPQPTIKLFDPSKHPNFPKLDRVSELGGLSLNDDGSALAFGISEWKDKKKPDPKPQDTPHVEVWNTKDVHEVPQQEVTAPRDRIKTILTVWHPATDTYHTITDGKDQGAMLLYGFDNAVLIDPDPYENPVTNGIHYNDIYIVNTETGLRTKVLDHTQWIPSPSRKGKYLAFYQGKNWWLYDVANDKKTNLTGSIKTHFDDIDDDHTIQEKPAAGTVTWLANDHGVILEDKYDCYLVRMGVDSITPLTNGHKDHIVFRFTDPAHAEDGPSIQSPFFFTSHDEDTKASGIYKCDSTGKGKMLVLDNMSFAALTKSKDVDRMIFTMGSFVKSPDLYLTNLEFTAIKPESKTNPQQDNFLWGHTELIKYKSRWGKDLQGCLIYPADYVKGRSYPMVTYIYEKLSDSLNSYMLPIDWSPYDPQVLSQNGYFVLMPDITYKPRNPGLSAVDCLEPAVDAVLAKHVGVDSAKVGLMGHSWGAYQTAFVTTVSKVFAVGVAGAPLTELTSMYNSFYWNAGITDQEIFESSQGRMEVPFWEDPKVYFDNSPVWQSAKRSAPILITFGDHDGAVDWHQGQYLFNTLRRMGKNAVMLVYAGENHGLAIRANQIDYAHRVRHFLDVYLKGAKPEPWVSSGLPLLQQQDSP